MTEILEFYSLVETTRQYLGNEKLRILDEEVALITAKHWEEYMVFLSRFLDKAKTIECLRPLGPARESMLLFPEDARGEFPREASDGLSLSLSINAKDEKEFEDTLSHLVSILDEAKESLALNSKKEFYPSFTGGYGTETIEIFRQDTSDDVKLVITVFGH